jgi:mRNA interferase MazF
MITTSVDPPWPGDATLEELDMAGLPRPCIVRLKLFTLDNRLLLSRAGHLGPKDRKRVGDELRRNVPGLVRLKRRRDSQRGKEE